MDKPDGEKAKPNEEKPDLTLSEVLEESQRLRDRSERLMKESTSLGAKIEEARLATEKTQKLPHQ